MNEKLRSAVEDAVYLIEAWGRGADAGDYPEIGNTLLALRVELVADQSRGATEMIGEADDFARVLGAVSGLDLMTEWKPNPEAAALEQAYRRGFTHGYSEGMDAVLEAAKDRRCSARTAWGMVAWFYDGPLIHWRHANHGGRLDIPPTFNPKADYREGEQ